MWCLILSKNIPLFYLSMRMFFTYLFRNIVYVDTIFIRWCKRYCWNLSSEATYGLRLSSLSYLYFLLLEISIKREILIRKIAESASSVLDITSWGQKETYSKKATTIRRRGKLYEWRYRRKVIWFHANRPPFFPPHHQFHVHSFSE